MNFRNLLSHRIFQGIMPILISYVYVSTERLFIQIDYDFHLQYTVYTTICSLQVKIILSVEGFSNEVNRDSRLKSRASKKLGSKNWSIGLRGLQSTHRSTLVLQNHCISTCIYRLQFISYDQHPYRGLPREIAPPPPALLLQIRTFKHLGGSKKTPYC